MKKKTTTATRLNPVINDPEVVAFRAQSDLHRLVHQNCDCLRHAFETFVGQELDH